ncbi:MAG: ferredoxin, partial [Epsilonproteobacteria bacterium]|nr:ferredoxin [Campylobacterota bacterium]
TGKMLYPNAVEELRSCDFIVSAGVKLRNDNPAARYIFNNIQKLNKGAGLYFHPVGDNLVPTFGKSVSIFNHKPGDEEYVMLLLLDIFANKDKLPKEIKDKLKKFKEKRKKTISKKVMEEVVEVVEDKDGNKKEVKKKVPKTIKEEVEYEANLLVERLGGDVENFDEELEKMLKKKEQFGLMVGEDFYFHPKAKNLANLVALLEESSDFKIAFIPPKSNALGVALICDLDEEEDGFVVGYNEPGDYKISALGDGDFNIPAMNQQEGTMTNMNKRVVPLNAALDFDGYELNDILNELGFNNQYTIDWTPKLPTNRGFQVVNFDDLPNEFTNDQKENRGYILANLDVEKKGIEIEDFSNNPLEGEIAYRCNPQRQFNDFTNKAHQIFEKFGVYASSDRAKELGDRVVVKFENGKELELEVIEDDRMSGDIVEIPDFKSNMRIYDIFGKNRYAKVTIKKV